MLTAANAPSPSIYPIKMPSKILYIDIANILIIPGAATTKNSRQGFVCVYIRSVLLLFILRTSPFSQ